MNPRHDRISAPWQLLKAALEAQFGGPDAGHLAHLFDAALSAETICYEHIDLPADKKDDILLAAFEERALIPVKSSKSAAWEDRMLALAPGERYFIPEVIRILMASARDTGRLDPENAVEQALFLDSGALSETGRQGDRLAAFVESLKRHAESFKAEVGLMKAIGRQCQLSLDLHDVIDILVICGIISPCTHGPAVAGLSWYEVNACLYWNCRQQR